MTQKLQINQQWQADFLIDRTQTLKQTLPQLNPNVPLASGSTVGDYTAVAVGVGYLNESWSGNGRVEWRHSDLDDKLNILRCAALLGAGRTVAAGFIYSENDSALAHSSKFEGRIPTRCGLGKSWILLDRFE